MLSFLLKYHSTAAFGSIWRFPWLSYKWGGGVFLIPFISALIFVGIPILTLEFSLGQVFQSGNVVAFGSISKRLRGLGFASLFAGFMLAGYYSVLAAYAGYYFVNSFWTPQPWEADWTTPGTQFDAAKNFFLNNVLHYTEQPTGVIAAGLFASLVVTWSLIYFFIFKGPNVTGKIVPTTYFISVGMLAAILGRALFLPGGVDGLLTYTGNWDFSVLMNPMIWSDGVSQVLFTCGVCFGVMTAYASYNNQNQGAVLDSVLVASFSALFSIFCGVVVFSVLGYMANLQGIPISDLVTSGLDLAFIAYPVALSLLPIPQIWTALFFASLFFIGINPALSLSEAVITVYNDSKAFKNAPRYAICSTICAIGLAMSTAYCADVGKTMIEAMDHYINSYLLLIVAFTECVAVGWIYCADQQRRQIGSFSTIFMGFTYFVSMLAGITCSLVLNSQYNPVPEMLNWWYGAVLGGGVFLLGSMIALACAKQPYEGADEVKHGKVWWLLLSNPEMARSDINSVIGRRGCGIGVFWSILMKYFLPVGLAVMFAINAQGTVMSGGYKPTVYSLGYQIFGLSAAGFGAFLIFIGVAFPSLFESLWPAEKVEDESATSTEKQQILANKVGLEDRDDIITDAGISMVDIKL